MIRLVLADALTAWSPIIVALVAAVPTTYGVVLYRRAPGKDVAAAQSATVGDAAIQRAFDVLDVNLADEREESADLRKQLRECRAAYADLKNTSG